MSRFGSPKKDFLTLAILFGVEGKVLGIDSKKILRPDAGYRSHYYPSYDIFCETQIFRHPNASNFQPVFAWDFKHIATTENDITRVIMSPMTWVRSQNFPCVNP